ncbi:MAG: hypothetical protein PHN84_09100 [Desulfuromonadaceae bacterium]|nr:hypothetical protein [Desulfuromonadaceae bacterium]MDD2854489.1 hypothetical protein [Desulfuromonadaceae bacterium]
MWKKMIRNMEWLLIVALLAGAVVAVGCDGGAYNIYVANAGPDRVVEIGTQCTLTGTLTLDGEPSKEAVWRYFSVHSSGPEPIYTRGAYDSSTNTISLSVSSAVPGRYVFLFGVPDEVFTGQPSDFATVYVIPQNYSINAGEDRTINIGETVLLTGTGNLYGMEDRWYQGAIGETQLIGTKNQDLNEYTYSFTPNAPGSYTFTYALTAGDYVITDTVTITVNSNAGSSNTAPVADAGTAPSNISIDTQVLLSGSGSDADNDPFTYKWTLANPPASKRSTPPTLFGADTPAPYFTPVEDGDYIATLIVNDGTVDSAPSTVTITVPPASSNYVTDLQNALANNAFLVFFNNDFLETIEFGQVGGNMTFTYMMPSWYPSYNGNTSIQRTGTWTVADAGGFAQATENAGPRTLNTDAPVNSTNTLLMTGYMSYNNTSSVDIATWIKTAALANATLYDHKLSASVDGYTLSYQFNADGTGVHVEDIYSHPFTWAIDASTRKVVVTFAGGFTDRNGVVNSKHNLFMTERHKADIGKREFGVVRLGNSDAVIGGIMLVWDWL